MKFAIKAIWQYPPYLRHVATLPWEIKHSNFQQIWKKTQTNCFLIASNFVIYPQMLIFSVLKIVSLSSLRTKRCSRSLYLTICKTTASTHPVTQGSTALPLCAYCAVARRSASRWWSQWLCQSSAVLHSFIQPGVKVDGRYYRDVLLKQQMLPLMHRIAGDTCVF